VFHHTPRRTVDEWYKVRHVGGVVLSPSRAHRSLLSALNVGRFDILLPVLPLTTLVPWPVAISTKAWANAGPIAHPLVDQLT
jgi:hypothetical protein